MISPQPGSFLTETPTGYFRAKIIRFIHLFFKAKKIFSNLNVSLKITK